MTLLLASCRNPALTDKDIVVDLNKLTHEAIPLSLFVDSITYLDLDSSNEAITKIPDNVIFTDSLIVVQDGMKPSGVALFNNKGKFIRRIGHRGQGPGEYLRLRAIDASKDTIYLLDNRTKAVLKYDFEGNYGGKDTLGHIGYGDDLSIVKNGNSFDYLIANYNDYDKYSGIFLFDSKARTANKILGCRDKNAARNHIYEFFNNNGQISVMTRDFENKVFKWTGDSLELEYNLVISPSPSQSELSRLRGCDRIGHYIRTAFYNTDRWLILNFWREDDNFRIVVIDKSKRQVYVGSDLINDIDENKFFITPTAINGALVRTFEPEDESAMKIAFQHLKK